MSEAVKRFQEFLGKQEKGDFVQEARAEVLQERAEKKKDKAKEYIVKAIELQEQKAEAEKKFKKEQEKFDKELGSIMNTLDNMAGAKPTEPAEEHVRQEHGD